MSFRLLSSIYRGTWLISKKHAEGYIPVVANFLDGKEMTPLSIKEKEELVSKKLYGKVAVAGAGKLPQMTSSLYEISDYGESNPPEQAPQNSIAILSFQQVITKYDTYCGPSGMLTKTNLLKRAANNPNIKAIILYVDSPGGEADGTEQLSNYIREVAKQKPVIAFIDGLAASAGYWIVSQATEIIVNVSSAEVGSIGAYVSFADFKGAFEARGIKIHTVYAPQSTEKNKDVRDIIDQEKPDATTMQKSLQYLVDIFIGSVKTGRGSKLNASKGDPFKGAVYFAEEAKEIGLVDALGTFEYAVDRAEELSVNTINSSNNSNTNMNKLTAAYNTAVKAIGLEKLAINDEATEVSEENINQLTAELANRGQEINTLTTDLSKANEDLAAAQAAVEAATTQAATDVKTITDLTAQVEKLGKLPGAEATSTSKEKETLIEGEPKASFVDPNAEHNKLRAQLDGASKV